MLNVSPALQAQLPRIFAAQDLATLLETVGLDKDDFVVRYPYSAMFCDRRHAFDADRDLVILSCTLNRMQFLAKYGVTPTFLKAKGLDIGFSTKPVEYIEKEGFKVEPPADQKLSRLLHDLFLNKEFQDEAQ